MTEELVKFCPPPKYGRIYEPFANDCLYSLLYNGCEIMLSNNDIDIVSKLKKRIKDEEFLNNWQCSHVCYYNIFNEEATWFIDAPKQIKTMYFDFEYFAYWCRNRKGQVIVIEHKGAKWLDFKPIISGSETVIWSNFPIKTKLEQTTLW